MNKYVKTFEEYVFESSTLPSKKIINEVKKDMLEYYGFKLTDEQVKDYLINNKMKSLRSFETDHREQYADHLAKEITGMDYPMGGDSEEEREKFFQELASKSEEKGYEWSKDWVTVY